MAFALGLLGFAAQAQVPGFTEVFQRHGVVMLLIDPQSGAIIDANPAAARFYGHTTEQLKSMAIQDINTLTPEQVAEEYATAARLGRNYFVFRHRLASGEMRTVQVHSNPFRFGERTLLLSVIHDITAGRNIEAGMWQYQQRLEELVNIQVAQIDRARQLQFDLMLGALLAALGLIVALVVSIRRARQAEKQAQSSADALTRREALFGALFEQGGFKAAILDDQGRLVQVNRQGIKGMQLVAGMETHPVLGHLMIDLPLWQRPADRARLQQALDRARLGQRDRFESTHDMADGSRAYLENHTNPVRIEEQLFVSLTAVDITARKLAQEALQQSQDALHAAIETIGEAFVIYDADDRLLVCNEHYRRVYPSVADLMQPGVRFEDLLRARVAREAYDAEGLDAETWVQRRLQAHRNGQEVIQHCDNDRWIRVVERKTPQGHIAGFRVDITDLVHARQAAEAANVAKSRFLSTMSHELRTPMNGVLGMAQLLLTETLSDEKRREYAQTILHCGQALLSLLNDVLDLSKIEAGKLTLEMGAVCPVDILRETRLLFMSNAQEKGLKFSAHWRGQGKPCFRGDPYRVQQMLTNLVNNAIKFTQQGEVSMEARVLQAPGGAQELEFSVRDSGIGIADDKQERLFRPFTQVDDSTTREYGGTGLGLSIVRSLAQAMGGVVGVESVVGQGSRFWFRLPVTALDDNSLCLVAPKTPNVQPTTPLQGRVLVAEDHPINREVISALLSQLGLEHDCVEDGQAALERIQLGQPAYQVVLMDVEMPRLDGCAATERLRAWEAATQGPRLPVVALTASAFAEDRQRCLDSGMDDYLSKPVDMAALAATLRRFLTSDVPVSQKHAG